MTSEEIRMYGYRSKPTEVLAWWAKDWSLVPDWIDKDCIRYDPVVGNKVYDKLHDTWITVNYGDWIIRGTEGELYPCADKVFQKKYEAI